MQMLSRIGFAKMKLKPSHFGLKYASLHYDNRRAHIGMNVAVIGKSTGGLKRKLKGAANSNGTTIKRLPVVTGYSVWC